MSSFRQLLVSFPFCRLFFKEKHIAPQGLLVKLFKKFVGWVGGACRRGLLCTLSLKKVIMVFAELFTIKSEVVVAGMEVDGYIKKK